MSRLPHFTALGRSGLALSLAAALLAPALTSARPALADHPPEHQPHARLMLVIRSIQPAWGDPGDFVGDGEHRIKVEFGRWDGEHLADKLETTLEFSAGADNREPPVEIGRTLAPMVVGEGDTLVVRFVGEEVDPLNPDDYLGTLVETYTEEQDWGIGEHSGTSVGGSQSHLGTFQPRLYFRANYEIVPVPLSDLTVDEIYSPAQLIAGQPSQVCVRLRNDGRVPSRPFTLELKIGERLTVRDHRPLQLGIAPDDKTHEYCRSVTMPGGLHEVTAIIDGDHQVDELDEYNNRHSVTMRWGIATPRPGELEAEDQVATDDGASNGVGGANLR